jgi:glycosyltransferase involved in cell wall biosynthesis
MKICIMGKSINMVSGHSKPAFELADELIHAGNDVVILTSRVLPGFKNTPYQSVCHENFEILKPSNSLMLDLYLGKNEALNNILNDSDIIHLFDYIPPSLIKSCVKTSVPIIYTLNGPYKVRIGELVTAGAPSFLNMVKPNFLFTPIIPNAVFKKKLNNFDKIISTSNYMAEDIFQLGIAKKKVEVIPLWINMQNFHDITENDTARVPTFVYFGWGSSIRGVPDVVRAFKLVLEKDPDAKLIMCFTGFHGIEEKMYKYLLEKSEIVNSIVLKMGYDTNIFKIIKSADVVVLPFRSTCGYAHPPLVILEAMALGKPVISTFVGSVPEVISDGVTGFLVQPRDVNALAQKMLLVSDDKELSQKIGNQAWEYIIKKHNLKDTTQKIIEVYKNMKEEFYG